MLKKINNERYDAASKSIGWFYRSTRQFVLKCLKVVKTYSLKKSDLTFIVSLASFVISFSYHTGHYRLSAFEKITPYIKS